MMVIIRETRIPGEYYTVNGKRVLIDGSELCTRDVGNSCNSSSSSNVVIVE